MFWNKIYLPVITQFCLNKETFLQVGSQALKLFLTTMSWLTHSLTPSPPDLISETWSQWGLAPGRNIFHYPNQNFIPAQ